MKKFLLTALLASAVLGASAATESFEFSYCSTSGPVSAIGTSRAETYGVAMAFYEPAYAGMKITHIDAYLNIDEAALPSFSDFKVFMSATPPASAAQASILSADVTPQEASWGRESGLMVLSYDLPNPYTLTNNGLFIGYYLTVDNVPTSKNTAQKYPILIDKSVTETNAFIINTPSLTEGEWAIAQETIQDFSAGAPIIVVTIERETYDYSLGITRAQNAYAEQGQGSNVILSVNNNGKNAVETIGYRYSIEGGVEETGTLTLEQSLAPDLTRNYQVMIPLVPQENLGEYIVDVTLTEINGHPNESPNASAFFEFDVLPYIPQHTPLVEEYTALSCGYCPRGYVAMEYLSKEYPQDAIVICYHLEFNGARDPMTVTPSAPVNTTNYPTASIDRVSIIDPYYGDYTNNGTRDMGIIEDMFARAQELAIADIKISNVSVSIPDSVINFSTDVTFMKDANNDAYRIGYVLSCDGLYSPTWKQTNYFSHDQQYKDTPLIQQFYSLPGSVYGLTFNDVAINTTAMRGISNSLTDITPYETKTQSYSIDVKDILNIYRESLNPYVEIHRMYINAFVIDRSNGTIVNACKFPIRSIYSGVESIDADAQNDADAVYYDLLGRPVNNPENGVYVKVVGGKASKVIL